MSRYGGILVSTIALLLYNHYLTDALTSFKAFDAAVLRSLTRGRLRGSGYGHIVAKLSRQRGFFLEVPVFFKPRTLEQGKKITLRGGLAAVFALIRFRFTRRDT